MKFVDYIRKKKKNKNKNKKKTKKKKKIKLYKNYRIIIFFNYRNVFSDVKINK